MPNYGSVLNQATAAYNAAIQGYQATLAQQQAAQQGVIAGYNKLSDDTFNDLKGASDAQAQAIVDKYAAQSGQQQQDAIGHGLGNTTVLNSLQRGLTLDEAKAQTDLASRFAATKADARQRIGLAGLGYEGEALNQNLSFAGQGLGLQARGAIDLGQLGLTAGKYDQDYQLALKDLALKQYGLNNQNQGRGGYGGYGGGGSSDPFGVRGQFGTLGGGSVREWGGIPGQGGLGILGTETHTPYGGVISSYDPYAAGPTFGGGDYGSGYGAGYTSSSGDFGEEE